MNETSLEIFHFILNVDIIFSLVGQYHKALFARQQYTIHTTHPPPTHCLKTKNFDLFILQVEERTVLLPPLPTFLKK